VTSLAIWRVGLRKRRLSCPIHFIISREISTSLKF
jgi:hypothetical protein